MANELRTGINKINLVGVVKEHKLKEHKDDKGSKYINGSLVLGCGDNIEIELRVYVTQFGQVKEGEKLADKKEKVNYTTLKKFIDEEYKTLVSSREEATIVTVYGNKDFNPTIKEERYPNQTKTDVTTKLTTDLGFGTIKVTNDVEEKDFHANFDIEMYVTSVDREVKVVGEDEEETGRVVVSGYVPCYGGNIFPMKVVTGIIKEEGEEDYNFAEDIEEGVSEGDTLNIWGVINFGKIIEQKSKGGKLGKAKLEAATTYVNEFIGTGADIIEDEEVAFDEDLVEKAVKERKIKLDEILDKAKNEEGSSDKGKGLNKTEKKKPKF